MLNELLDNDGKRRHTLRMKSCRVRKSHSYNSLEKSASISTLEQRMPKRKFDQYVERPDIAGSASNISIHQARLTDGLTPGTAKVLQALKLARGFERQKLGRRRKIAEKEKDDTLMRRLREETEAIKVCLSISNLVNYLN